MKKSKYQINNKPVKQEEFERKLRLCCTKGTENGLHVAAGCTCGGVLDYSHYNEIKAKLAAGWRYTCIYEPQNIHLTFKIIKE